MKIKPNPDSRCARAIAKIRAGVCRKPAPASPVKRKKATYGPELPSMARKLRLTGLSYSDIAKRVSEASGKDVPVFTARDWCIGRRPTEGASQCAA